MRVNTKKRGITIKVVFCSKKTKEAGKKDYTDAVVKFPPTGVFTQPEDAHCRDTAHVIAKSFG